MLVFLTLLHIIQSHFYFRRLLKSTEVKMGAETEVEMEAGMGAGMEAGMEAGMGAEKGAKV